LKMTTAVAMVWDTAAILNVIENQWHHVFRNKLDKTDRSLVIELRDSRNRWAHQEAFSTDDTYRLLDSVHRLLMAVAAGEEAAEVDTQRQELLRLKFTEQARSETRKIAGQATDGNPKAGLQPWRDIVAPHTDVSSGEYQKAEFAADLWVVHNRKDQAAKEYTDPVEFFRRTFLTQGLRSLLANSMKRLVRNQGDPMVALQTNFGGGKTHCLLALYHLYANTVASSLPNVDELLAEAGVSELPAVKRAVVVGTYFQPSKVYSRGKDIKVRTIWGEIAWQLCGAKGYEVVRHADETGTNPGDDLVKLFDMAGPCLILIDEWVAYARQLYANDKLPGGTFDTQFTFAQALTDAASASPNTLVVVSIPTSDIEKGGQHGQAALDRLVNVVARREATWQPASTDEGFEIVRRRLFQPIADQAKFRARDAVIHAFIDAYRANAQDFPVGCGSADYEKRMMSAYPIHPDVFDRLYTEWSTLDSFQRTCGVLRLMAAVIHELWEKEERNLLIMPGMIPMDDTVVRSELSRYLEPAWPPVIENDVDGPDSTPLAIYREITNLGRYSATRRVARTVFLGTAPLKGTANRGKDIRQVNLGCVQPGESIPIFGDALRRLQNRATYINTDGERTYYDTAQNINRDAESRKAAFTADDVNHEIREVLKKQVSHRGDFVRVHTCPQSAADVPDERDARLVILAPEAEHLANKDDSPAMLAARELLETRGTGPRIYRNTLAFVAADKTRIMELRDSVRWAMAWRAIDTKREELNLDPTQVRTAQAKRKEWDGVVEQRIPEAYCWLLVPGQSTAQAPVEWHARRMNGQEPLAVRASKKMKTDELLVTQLGAVRLRMELDRVPLWRGDDVEVRQLAEDFAQYLYLPRLQRTNVLTEAVSDGLDLITWRTESFAYAERKDASTGRYHGLRCGEPARVSVEIGGWLVRPQVAEAQRAADIAKTASPRGTSTIVLTGEPAPGVGQGHRDGSPTAVTKAALPTCFYGTVQVDARRLGRDAGRIAEEVVSHLLAIDGAAVTVTIEIRADIDKGIEQQIVRAITENCRTLNFKVHGFDET
jgi:predicted AAA+ superfamily ATPase